MTVLQTTVETPLPALYASPPATLDFAPTTRVRSMTDSRDTRRRVDALLRRLR